MQTHRIRHASVLVAVAVAACTGGGALALPRVAFETDEGVFVAEIDSAAAPRTAANFLAYVDAGFFDGGSFFRTVRADNQPDDDVLIDVVQGGPDRSRWASLRPPIALERTSVTGLTHADGTLSMARAGPDTGRAQFFICVGDQPELDFGGARNPDGQGFAAFGRVVSGMGVVRRIHAAPAEGQRLTPVVGLVRVRRVPPSVTAGLDDLEARVQARLDSLVAPRSVPGVTLGIAFAPGRTLAFAAGMADTARRVAMPLDARMLQGSVGKTYFGATALQLVGEGRLDLDAPIARYLADEPWLARVPNGGQATVRQLMGHTSGIVRYELDPAFLRDLTADPMRTFTAEERLSYLFGTEAPFAAGEGWDYSDTNYILLALILERITGNAAYDEIRRRFLDPLGLAHTVPSDRPDVPGLVMGYGGPDNPFGGFDEMLVDGHLAINPQFEWGGGGFASTADDLARWMLAVQRGEAFDPDLLDDFRTGTPAPLGPEARYGLGVIMMELPTAGTAWGHSGFMPGYRTEAYYFPEHGFAMALQVNTTAQGALPVSPLHMLDGLAALVVEEGGP